MGYVPKVEKVMHEFGQGKLHSGSKDGPVVTNPKQAVAIAMSEAGMSRPKYSQRKEGCLKCSGHPNAHRVGRGKRK